MSRKSSKILGLESNDDGFGEVGLEGEGLWLSTVIRTVSELLTHETIRVVSVIRTFGDTLISIEVPSNQVPASRF